MSDKPALTDQEIAQILKPKDAATNDFLFQQTMYRIKDPRRSLEFYNKVLGMILLKKMDFPGAKFSLFFMGFENEVDVPKNDEKERAVWAMTRKATLELTHNWGTENDPNQAYNFGNGYGHIGILVPDVYAACKRFDELGVEYVKRPDEGRMKGLAFIKARHLLNADHSLTRMFFIKDPDGYWIEIFSTKTVANNA